MFKYVIFDVDGTILDTEKAILKSLQQVLKEEGRDYQAEDLRFALGIPGNEALRRLNVQDIERVHTKWSKAELALLKEVQLFEDIKEVLEVLLESPHRTGIVTSKTRQELMAGYELFGISRYFESSICATDTDKHKPHPEPLLACLEELEAEKDEAIYIGDSIYDLQCAHSAGVKFALALWGAKKIEGFESADFILKEPKDILDLLKKGR